MKFLATLVFMAGLTDASRHYGESFHHDKKGNTRAVCQLYAKEQEKIATSPRGWVQLTQAATNKDGSIGATSMNAYMGLLDEGTTYSLELIDDDDDSCDGTYIGKIGTTTANNRGRGKIMLEDIGHDVDGNDSIISAYLRLSDGDGAEVACCEIIEH